MKSKEVTTMRMTVFLVFILVFSLASLTNQAMAEEENDLGGSGPPEDQFDTILDHESTTSGSSFTTIQYVSSPRPPFGDYRWYNEDFGWQHTFDPTGKQIISATLEIRAYDVDWGVEAFWEHNLVYADGNLIGELGGANAVWSITTFAIDPALLADGQLNIWLDIDSTHTTLWWAVTTDWSRLTVVWDFARSIEKTLSVSEGELGDVVDIALTVRLPSGETATVVDTLPGGFHYLAGTFTVDGVPATPTIDKHDVIFTVSEHGEHVLEFDIKVDEAKTWEDMEVCNTVTATWFDEAGDELETKEDVECFTILAFEQLSKSVTKSVYWEDYHDTNGDSISGNYKDFADALTAAGFAIDEISTAPIDYATLSGYDILVLNDPETALSSVEIAAIQTWLSDGGHGLFVIGEWYAAWHRDSVNTLLSPYGLQATTVVLGSPTITEFAVHPALSGLTSFGPGAGAWGTLTASGTATEIAWADVAHTQAVLGTYEAESKIALITNSDLFWNSYISQANNLQLGIDIMTWLDPDPLVIKEKTETQWQLQIEVTNPYGYTMTNAVIKDRFGAEIEIDEPFPVSITHGTASFETKGKSEKVFLTWEIGDLLPGETARLVILVSTDINPDGHQQYSEPGTYELNSGATLKFIDPEQEVQLSAYTDSILVTVLPEEDP